MLTGSIRKKNREKKMSERNGICLRQRERDEKTKPEEEINVIKQELK
jgi:hypothetical protein